MSSLNPSKYGFNQNQATDLRIMMSLTDPKDVKEWMEFVGPEDVEYGISLLECLALALLDEQIDSMVDMPEAAAVLARFKQ